MLYNSKAVITGIVVFLVICTAPFWANIGGGDYKKPEVVVSEKYEKCVESVAFMRAEHMQLLNEWRDQALRSDNRLYLSSDGTKWEISLQNTCLKCHSNYDEFCDKCHVTNNVDPYCWTCHILPKGSK